MKVYTVWILIFGMIFSISCSSDKQQSTTQPKQSAPVAKKEPDHPGKILYMQFCLACHMEGGQGVPGLYPPLIQTEYVLGEKDRLIGVVLNGMQGPIEVKGEQYNNIMAKLDYLQDQQIADVLSYVRSHFGNEAGAITAAEGSVVRAGNVN